MALVPDVRQQPRPSHAARLPRSSKDMFVDILKVGAISIFSPLQGVTRRPILTGMLARFGTELLAATASARGSNSC